MIDNLHTHPSLSHRMPWKRSLAGIALLVACAGASGLADFTGRWTLDSSRSNRIDSAIEACIADYSEEAKTTTRERLQETNSLAHAMYFTASDGDSKVLIGYDTPDDGTVAPLDGTEVPTTGSTGESFQLTVVLENDTLVESFQANNGKRTNTYTIAPDGKTLFMQVVVESPYMPNTLNYTLAYARADSSTALKAVRSRSGPMVKNSEKYGADGRILMNLAGRRFMPWVGFAER